MTDYMDTIIIGGTYNPVHIGHMHLADEVKKKFRPKRIIMLPSYISAHKTEKDVVSSEHRLAMLKIAIKKTDYIVEECELERKGVSYTIDSLSYIKNKYDLEIKPGLVIGDDLLDGFENWKRAEEITDEVNLIIARRNNKNTIDFKYKHLNISNLVLNISSSDIRYRLTNNYACRYLMPAGVFEYIYTNKLYGVEECTK